MIFSIMDTEIITRETLELIAQQSYTTQLVILLIIVIVVGGSIALFTLRGGLKVFDELNKSIQKGNELDAERIKNNERLTSVIETIEENAQLRYRKIEELVNNIDGNINNLSGKMVELKEIIQNNPNDEKMYRLLMRINQNLERTKESTDELEKIENA